MVIKTRKSQRNVLEKLAHARELYELISDTNELARP